MAPGQVIPGFPSITREVDHGSNPELASGSAGHPGPEALPSHANERDLRELATRFPEKRHRR